MARGDLYEATADGTVSYVDIGLYDSPEYGSVYIVDAEKPAVIDTGLGTHVDVILNALERVGISPTELHAIVPTHVHLDHAGGAGYLAEECPNADVYCYESGAPFLLDPTSLWKGTQAVIGPRIVHYVEPKPVPEERLVPISDGEVISLGDQRLITHHAPGHAFHQAVFEHPASNGIFVADAAGINTPRIDGVRYCSPPSDFDLEQCLEDIELLRSLNPEQLYYGHFGAVETDGMLEEFAEQQMGWVEQVKEKRATLSDDEAVVEFFAERADTIGIWDERHARGEEQLNVRGVLEYLDAKAEYTGRRKL